MNEHYTCIAKETIEAFQLCVVLHLKFPFGLVTCIVAYHSDFEYNLKPVVFHSDIRNSYGKL